MGQNFFGKFINKLNSHYKGAIFSINKICKDRDMIERAKVELNITNIETGKNENKTFFYPVLPDDEELKSLYEYLEQFKREKEFSTDESFAIKKRLAVIENKLAKIQKETLSDNALLEILIRISKLENKFKILEKEFPNLKKEK